jgi:Helix-turn-helix domain
MNTLDLQAAAAFLHIHPVTLQEKARAGEIPGAKIGKRWVFVDVDLIEHIRSQYPRRVLQSERKEFDHVTLQAHRFTALVDQDQPQRNNNTAQHWD